MLTLFHTASANKALFSSLLAELAPEIPVQHIIDENILRDAREAGVADEITQRVTDAMLTAVNDGSEVVLCTCSTIGNCAEAAQSFTTKTIQRVDRAMAEKAVALGSRIIIAATLASTMTPTRELVLDAANKANKQIEIIERLCQSAWAKFEAGDKAGYLAEIAADLRTVANQGDVIVLAQASMMGAEELCQDFPIPVLSSPRLGVEAAISAYQASMR